MEGCFSAKKKDGSIYYRASMTYRAKHISLGSFSVQENAAGAYREAKRLLSDASLSLSDYAEGCFLSTPLYVRPRFFYYYLSKDLVLKFDVDDLFYYSSHKIMKRGGHYFVADFGMQVNILNRYGIKNYAVSGRDYRFENGDTTDFRRENLVILNRYHGVSYEKEKGLYLSKIHVRGNYVIGRYATMDEAAIAYNKAVDILKKAGCPKAFVPNYVENIPAGMYAEIYTRLPVSSKLYAITFSANP